MNLRYVSIAVLLWGVLGTAPAAAVDTFGIVGGINLSKWSGDSDSRDISFRTGPSIGAFASWKFSQSTGFLLEVMYSSKGADVAENIRSAFYPDSPRTVLTKSVLRYLEIPLLLEIDLSAHQETGFFFLVGPVVSFSIGSSFEIILPEGAQIAGETDGKFTDLTSPDIGALVGGGLKIPVGRTSVRFSVRYNHGLRDNGVWWPDSKNRSWMILAGIGS